MADVSSRVPGNRYQLSGEYMQKALDVSFICLCSDSMLSHSLRPFSHFLNPSLTQIHITLPQIHPLPLPRLGLPPRPLLPRPPRTRSRFLLLLHHALGPS